MMQCKVHISLALLDFSPEEAGRYLETYKAYENKPPDLIMEKTESNFLAQVSVIAVDILHISTLHLQGLVLPIAIFVFRI